MNMNIELEVPDPTGSETRGNLPRIAIVGDASMGATASLLRAIRESDLAGQVIVLEGNLDVALPQSRALSHDPALALQTVREALLAEAALGVRVGPRPAPYKLGAPRVVTQADNAKLEAARLKRERKAARLRAAGSLS